jgi:hypothetical protein
MQMIFRTAGAPRESFGRETCGNTHRASIGARYGSLQDLIFECRAFGIVLLEPFVRGDRVGNTFR